MTTKKNTVHLKRSKIFAIIFGLLLILTTWQCSSENKANLDIPENLFLSDYGKVGFILPNDTSATKYFTNYFFKSDSSIIFSTRMIIHDTPTLAALRKVELTKPTEMEIVFIENVLKYRRENKENQSQLINYGIYKKGGKLYRYKIIKTSFGDDLLKILYYFMETDYSDCFYELDILATIEQYEIADSIITNIAESFTFINTKK